jgi:hypothetical protein
MNKNNTLARSNEVVLHAACRLIRSGPFVHHLTPGAMLRIQRISPFKCIIRWYAPTGEGPDVLEDYDDKSNDYFVVDRAWTTMSYWWHRARLGNKLYLRPMSDTDEHSRAHRLFKTCEVLM